MKKYQVLVFEPKLTHSVWQDWGSDEPLSEAGVVERLRAGVESGEYAGWRVLTIHQEVIGRDAVALARLREREEVSRTIPTNTAGVIGEPS